MKIWCKSNSWPHIMILAFYSLVNSVQLFKAAIEILLEDSKQGIRMISCLSNTKKDILLEGYCITLSFHRRVGCSMVFITIMFSRDSCSVASK